MMEKVRAVRKRNTRLEETHSKLLKSALGYKQGTSGNYSLGEWTDRASEVIQQMAECDAICEEYKRKCQILKLVIKSEICFMPNPVVIFCSLPRCTLKNREHI